jgi:hypothetical protein
MVDIMTALATASQAIKLANDLRGIDKAMDAAEFKLKIADLTLALSDIKMALSEEGRDWWGNPSISARISAVSFRNVGGIRLLGTKPRCCSGLVDDFSERIDRRSEVVPNEPPSLALIWAADLLLRPQVQPTKLAR